MQEWKRDFASGLIVLIPLLVSAYAIAWLYGALADLPLFATIEPPILRVVLTIVAFLVALLLVGAATRTAAGSVMSRWIDELINHVPGLRVVYNASKIAVETGVSGNTDIQRPVRVQTWDGLRMTAFKTGKYTDDGRMVLFLPTSPNITTGYVIEVEPDSVEPIDESVEHALTRIISGGFGDPKNRSRQHSIPIVEEPSRPEVFDVDPREDGEGETDEAEADAR